MLSIVSIIIVLIFSSILCLIEVPKMLKLKLYRELSVFLVLLLSGTIMMLLKRLDVEIPNPSDFLAWMHSPINGIMKSFYQ